MIGNHDSFATPFYIVRDPELVLYCVMETVCKKTVLSITLLVNIDILAGRFMCFTIYIHIYIYIFVIV